MQLAVPISTDRSFDLHYRHRRRCLKKILLLQTVIQLAQGSLREKSLVACQLRELVELLVSIIASLSAQTT